MTIFVVDCHHSQNQVRLHWRGPVDPIWTPGRGPDLLDTDEEKLVKHVKTCVDSELYTAYFERATLIECLLNQTLFNGIGAYVSSEVCYWLYCLKEVRPWTNFKRFCDTHLEVLVRIVRVYLRFMEKYISIHGAELTCIDFDERKWENFRSVFLRAYRQPSTLINGIRVKIQKFKFGLTKVGSNGLKITRSAGQCFTPALTPKEIAPSGWIEKRVNEIGSNTLGVGWFSWYGRIDRFITLNSERGQAIHLRPATEDQLRLAMEKKREDIATDGGQFDDDIESIEDSESNAETDEATCQKISCDNSIDVPRKKRKSQRKRIIERFNKEMYEICSLK